ncbi:MAG: YraN family protein [Burkholderiaceae bacterium]
MPTRGTSSRATGVRTPRQRAGAAAEQAAERHLVAAGCRVLARNARYREGELDLIMRERDLVVFVEVRLRSGARFGVASASVDVPKQKRLARAAQRWLAEHYGERWPACRFDVVTIDGDGRIDWLRDAFAT